MQYDIDDVITVDGKRYVVAIVTSRYLGCESVANRKFTRTIDTKTQHVEKVY